MPIPWKRMFVSPFRSASMNLSQLALLSKGLETCLAFTAVVVRLPVNRVSFFPLICWFFLIFSRILSASFEGTGAAVRENNF